MKLSKDQARDIAERYIKQSYKGKLKLSGARFVDHPSSVWGTPNGSLNGEWKVLFDKVVDDGDLFIEPHIIIIFVDAVTGETAKFPMI